MSTESAPDPRGPAVEIELEVAPRRSSRGLMLAAGVLLLAAIGFTVARPPEAPPTPEAPAPVTSPVMEPVAGPEGPQVAPVHRPVPTGDFEFLPLEPEAILIEAPIAEGPTAADVEDLATATAGLRRGDLEAARQKATEVAVRNLRDGSPEAFSGAAGVRTATQQKPLAERWLGAVDVSRDPYAAVAALNTALDGVDRVDALSESARRRAGRIAAQLGELGTDIVGARDDARFPLARRALEAAQAWELRDGDLPTGGGYVAELETLETLAAAEFDRANTLDGAARQEALDALRDWAPSRRPTARLLRAATAPVAPGGAS